MEEKRYRLSSAGALSVPPAEADALLALGDGECALLYLHILRTGGVLSPALAARELGRTEEQILAAAARLDRAGVLRAEGGVPLPGPEELPEYSARDILRRSGEDSAFRGLLTEAQRVLGHALSGADLKTLFGIYDSLGMAPDAVMLLINHCADRLRRRHGEGRLPTMRAIEKEAFRWANREILTVEQAEEHLAELARQEQEETKLRQLLQITGREPSASERKYLESWLTMGYSAEALALAYDRTVVSTGRLTWAYMDKIVRSWYEKGLFTPEEIEKGDARGQKRRRSAAPAVSGGGGSRGDDTDRLMDRLLGHTKE